MAEEIVATSPLEYVINGAKVGSFFSVLLLLNVSKETIDSSFDLFCKTDTLCFITAHCSRLHSLFGIRIARGRSPKTTKEG
jgi:hypothetical protein